MSADQKPVATEPTEAQRRLAAEILLTFSAEQCASIAGVKGAAQLIADSERAAVEKAMTVANEVLRIGRVTLELAVKETDQLRAEVERLTRELATSRHDDQQARLMSGLIYARAEKAESALTAEREKTSVLREELEKCFWHLGKEITRMSLNESAQTGTQQLSQEVAKVLDGVPAQFYAALDAASASEPATGEASS